MKFLMETHLKIEKMQIIQFKYGFDFGHIVKCNGLRGDKAGGLTLKLNIGLRGL